MSISICLPTYNRAGLLEGAIRSVLGQIYEKFEFLILDDGSTDQTETVVSSFEDARIRYLKNKENRGYVPSLNKCAQLAQGDWVMFMSDDDVLLPTALDKMERVLGEEVGMVVPQTILINANGDVIATPDPQLRDQDYLLLRPTEFIPNYTLYGKKIRGQYQFNTSFPSTLFRRELFLRYCGDSKEIPVAHDLLIGAKIALKHEVVVIDEPLIRYRVHQNWGSSLNRQGKFLDEYRRYLELLFSFVQREGIEFEYDFEKYCYNALVEYLFRVDGGLLRLAAQYEGGYRRRLQKIAEYVKFGLRTRSRSLLSPQFYLALALSLLPRELLRMGVDEYLSIFRSRPRTKNGRGARVSAPGQRWSGP